MYGRSTPGGALVPLDVSLSVTITDKGHGVWCPVYGTLHIKDPLPFFEKSGVVILVAGFSYHLIDLIIKD